MINMMGVAYGRAATATITDQGPALAPAAIKSMFPDKQWTIVTPDAFNLAECVADRFGENFKIQQKIYNATPTTSHIMIGGDHSTNFGHFAAIADQFPDEDICLVYIDAHLDIHTPASSQAQASGAPHGTNVRALLGDGDSRWLSLQTKRPALRPENIFYLGTRSYEPAEIEYATSKNIYMRTPAQLDTDEKLQNAISEIKTRIGNRKFVVSFDFDAIDPKYFRDVLVPEPNGISANAAQQLLGAFHTAHSIEFVEYAPTGDSESARIAQQLIQIVAN
ncbi:MAG: arginase family protein [Alphaproteobacteria bacterium]|nr:arginase family protein [Alphaproteobacteria bacterium]